MKIENTILKWLISFHFFFRFTFISVLVSQFFLNKFYSKKGDATMSYCRRQTQTTNLSVFFFFHLFALTWIEHRFRNNNWKIEKKKNKQTKYLKDRMKEICRYDLYWFIELSPLPQNAQQITQDIFNTFFFFLFWFWFTYNEKFL